MEDNTGPSGSYTDENGVVHTLHIINDEVSIKFDIDNNVHDRNNETAYKLVSVTFDGWRADNVSMTIYEDIIEFCKKEIKKIPHYDVTDGKLEWIKGKE